jgi:hypothetical protein
MTFMNARNLPGAGGEFKGKWAVGRKARDLKRDAEDVSRFPASLIDSPLHDGCPAPASAR